VLQFNRRSQWHSWNGLKLTAGIPGCPKKTGVDEQEDREFSPLACMRQSKPSSLSSNTQAGVDWA
jgi:hypothetical protein